jgi:hypothetical protein
MPVIETPPFGLSPSKTADEVWEAQLGLFLARLLKHASG